MKAYFVSDLHFGVRNASVEWLNNQVSFFENFMIPNTEKNSYLIIGGDIFDNRQNLNIFVFHTVTNLFKRLSEHFKEIHIIIGNHDISNKTTNEVNALSIFNLIPNIFVYEKPELKILNGTKFLFLPWSNHEEYKVIQQYKPQEPDYLVMHTDISSLKLNKYREISGGVSMLELTDFKYVFNGHIHYRQEKDNIVMMGCPYHLNRNDLDNDKYIYVLDIQENKLSKILNNYSSKFKQIDFYSLIEMTETEAKKEFCGHYIYIRIPNSITFDNGINSVLYMLDCSRNIKILYYDDYEYQEPDIGGTEEISIENIMDEYINNLNQDDSAKLEIRNILEKYKSEIVFN